jgi:hypothetical protein
LSESHVGTRREAKVSKYINHDFEVRLDRLLEPRVLLHRFILGEVMIDSDEVPHAVHTGIHGGLRRHGPKADEESSAGGKRGS